MKKLTLLLAVGIGYVLGARAGRARYDQIKKLAFKVKEDPRVQSAASTVADTARQQAPVVADKVTSAASSAASAAAAKSPFGGSSSSSRGDELLEQLDPDSTTRQENPYPQGNLP
jgi:hypothetical protein